jgi:hypothetical protein
MKRTTKRKQERKPQAAPETPYLDRQVEVPLAGSLREQVVAQLVSRLKRDQGCLVFGKASGRATGYDERVMSDLQALALVAVLEASARDR